MGSVRFVFRPEQMLRDKNERRILAMHRGPEQAGGVFRCARDGDVDARIVREGSFVRLAVPQAAARQIGAIGRVDHHRAGPGAEGTPAQVREVRDELVPGRPDEVDELQLKHRSLAVGRETAADAEDGRFRERRIEDLLRKFGRELLRQAEDAAFRILDVFAEDDAVASLVSSPRRSALLTVSPMRYLPGGKHFVVELRQLAGDLQLRVRRPTDLPRARRPRIPSGSALSLPCRACS